MSATNKQVLAKKIVGCHRHQSALQTSIVMAVALGATMLVGLTGFGA